MSDRNPGGVADFGRSVFVCSKPLQAVHCASIARANRIQDARLSIVTGGIHEADEFRHFFESSRHAELFTEIGWHGDHRSAIDHFRGTDYDSLFIEDDRVSMYHLFAPLKRRYLSVFEEGIGTYFGPIVGELTGLRRLKWQWLAWTTGSGMDFGGGRTTDFVIVQSPAAYGAFRPHLSHKARGFPGLVDEIGHDLEAWEALARPGIGPPLERDEPACLVLGTWGSTMADYADVARCDTRNSFYKAHPHDGHVQHIEGAHLIPASWVPAEVFIGLLARTCPAVTVVHHASSVEFNLRDHYVNVTFVDVAAGKTAASLEQLIRSA